MDTTIQATLKSLKKTYIIHIIIIIIIIIFNIILVSQIYWLQKIFKRLYHIAKFAYIINLIPTIFSLIFSLKRKIMKKNVKMFRSLTIIFCAVAIIFGFFFAVLVMMNAIESPEFCKECPFNLPNGDIEYITEENGNKKCTERRCAKNSEKNETNYSEFICNYNPTSEFDAVKETEIIDNSNPNNHTIKSDNIICVEFTEEDLIKENLENSILLKFYDKCNSYTKFFMCERSKAPNKYHLEDNFVCPENNYMTKLVIFCMFNVVINLILGFYPWKSEYNKYNYLILAYEPRRIVAKSNSFSSTINSSKIQKDNIEEEVFERDPTEIIIVYGNNKNNINNDINNKNPKKLSFCEATEPPAQNQNAKNKTEIKITKNINIINNINIFSNKDKELKDDNDINKGKNDNKNKSEHNINKFEENKITLSYENNITSAEKISLSDKKK